MKRLQFLMASQNVTVSQKSANAPKGAAINKIARAPNRKIQIDLDELSGEQLIELRQHTYQKLCFQRRRCSARAINYDVNDHIRLYLMYKQLTQCTKHSGPN